LAVLRKEMAIPLVMAGKIFKIREEISLEAIASKLKNFRKEENYPVGDKSIPLLTEIRDLGFRTHGLIGTFSQDRVISLYRRGEIVPTIKTIEAPILFSNYGDMLLLTIIGKKWTANNIASQLQEILLLRPGAIVEGRIAPETLKRFHEENPAGTKVIFFDDVDIPDVNKLSFYGSALINSSLYNDYLKHGKIWYVVVTSRKGYVVGLTRNSVVTVFSRVDEGEFLDYTVDEVFPLISP